MLCSSPFERTNTCPTVFLVFVLPKGELNDRLRARRRKVAGALKDRINKRRRAGAGGVRGGSVKKGG